MMIFNCTSRILSSHIWRGVHSSSRLTLIKVLHLQHYSELPRVLPSHFCKAKQKCVFQPQKNKKKNCKFQSNHSLEAALISSKVSQQDAPSRHWPYLSLLFNFNFRSNLYPFGVIFDTKAKPVLKYYPRAQSRGTQRVVCLYKQPP